MYFNICKFNYIILSYVRHWESIDNENNKATIM